MAMDLYNETVRRLGLVIVSVTKNDDAPVVVECLQSFDVDYSEGNGLRKQDAKALVERHVKKVIQSGGKVVCHNASYIVHMLTTLNIHLYNTGYMECAVKHLGLLPKLCAPDHSFGFTCAEEKAWATKECYFAMANK